MNKIVIQAKSKIPKDELKPYNPFAVCNTSVGTEDSPKRERCIHHIKDQNKKKNKGKKAQVIEQNKKEVGSDECGDKWLNLLSKERGEASEKISFSKKMVIQAKSKEK